MPEQGGEGSKFERDNKEVDRIIEGDERVKQSQEADKKREEKVENSVGGKVCFGN